MIEELAGNSFKLGGRRSFLQKLGLATAGTAGLATLAPSRARADDSPAPGNNDATILNFALNLEYLEAEYYLNATTGYGLEHAGIDVGKNPGDVFVKMNPKLNFTIPVFEQYANEIATDEANHVRFLREAIVAAGGTPVNRPQINLNKSFNVLGSLIGLDSFDPFANEINFFLGAFIFEDVGVTAYKGVSPLLTHKGVRAAAAGILGAEAYHAGIIRTLLYSQDLPVRKLADKISNVRQSLDNSQRDKDQKLDRNGVANLVPTDGNSLVFSRNTRQVLNIVYGEVNADRGLFFPKGLNGPIS